MGNGLFGKVNNLLDENDKKASEQHTENNNQLTTKQDEINKITIDEQNNNETITTPNENENNNEIIGLQEDTVDEKERKKLEKIAIKEREEAEQKALEALFSTGPERGKQHGVYLDKDVEVIMEKALSTSKAKKGDKSNIVNDALRMYFKSKGLM